MTVKAAIYVRQSIHKDEGIERQLKKCREFAAAREWEVVSEYKDNDVSAFKSRGENTEWGKLLRDFKNKKFTHLVAMDMSRLLRSQKDLLLIRDLGIIVSTIRGDIDLSTSEGSFHASLLASAAEFEMTKKSERQKYANQYRVGQGRPVPGRRRFGYETDGITPRESEAAVVKWIFEQVSGGRSLRSTAIQLNKDGIVNATGRQWAPLRLRDLLSNPAYVGKVRHLGVTYDTKSEILPIVTQELFDKVAAILADPTRKKSPGGARRHVASGIATCGVCGKPLAFRNGYMCLANLSHPLIKKDWMEQRIAEEIFFWYVGHPELESVTATEGDSPSILAKITEIETLSARRDAFTELYVGGRGDKAKHLSNISALDKKLADLESSVLDERGSAARLELVDIVRGEWWERREFKEYTEKEDEALEAWFPYWEELDLEKKREVIKATIDIKLLPAGKGRERLGPEERVVITWKPEPKVISKKAKASTSTKPAPKRKKPVS